MFVCPVCGGPLVVLKSETRRFGVHPITGSVAQRPREKSTESIWMRCADGCPDAPVYEDLPDDFQNAAEALPAPQTNDGEGA